MSKHPVLSEGSFGKDVANLQRYLNDIGYGYDRIAGKYLAIDGQFGSLTKAAVIRLQEDTKHNGPYRGEVDGIVGPLTWDVIERLDADARIPQAS